MYLGREWRQGWWVGSITESDTMAYWKNCCVWHTWSTSRKEVGVLADLVRPGQLHRVAEAVEEPVTGLGHAFPGHVRGH